MEDKVECLLCGMGKGGWEQLRKTVFTDFVLRFIQLQHYHLSSSKRFYTKDKVNKMSVE